MDKNVVYDLQKRIALFEDMKAYQELYNLFFPALHRFACAFVRSNEAAEEIVSDVFIKIWQVRAKLMEINSLKEYIYVITKNFSLNYISRNYKNKTVSLDDIEFEPIVTLKNPEELFISNDIVNRVHQTIGQLAPKCKIIFQLVKEDGLSYKEVATILGISVFTVRNQLAIAVKKIGELLPPGVFPDNTSVFIKSQDGQLTKSNSTPQF